MPDETLRTLRQLADELSLPESTVRYYRDAFLDHIPSVGTGRRRRYPEAAVAVLRTIAASYAAGRTRAEIIAEVHGQAPPAQRVSLSSDQPSRTMPLEEVTNLDLLAAILDGEREQRDALWQMAKEIVRLSEVLEGQDSVLSEIADKAGVIMSNTPRVRTAPAVAALSPASEAPAPVAAATDPLPPISSFGTVSSAVPATPAAVATSAADAPAPASTFAAAPVQPAPPPGAAPAEATQRHFGVSPDMERLKAELEAERALVERLREAKLQIEHRAADAEAELADRNSRRPSVIRRLLGSEG